jgi:NAD(P)-dependent dehydrogenase (short-subunit alcohol dehydrogenase family)
MKRVCLLTGASGLFGRAFIKRYASEFEVVGVYHRNEPDFATQNQTVFDPLDPARPHDANEHAVFAIRADLATDEGADRVCAELIEHYPRIDLVINAAVHRRWASLVSSDGLSDAETAMRVNVLAPIRLAAGIARLFWRAHVDENLGMNRNIINISSTAGCYVYPDLGQAVYAATKAALNHATYHMASEFWDLGVRVNAVAPDTFPGRVRTEQVLDAVMALDRGGDTGRVVLVES